VKVVLFGATGMVGQGALRECLLAPDVERVLAVVRSPSGNGHLKLAELVHRDFTDFSTVAGELTGWDACLYCLGVTSAGASEVDYRRVTHDFALAAARTLADRNPEMTFVFVSGAGTDRASRTMWARVKGETEDAILRLPFRAAYIVRPAFIQPLHGIRSRTASYRVFYTLAAPIYPLLQRIAPGWVTTTERLGRAMLELVRKGFDRPVLENADVNSLGA
jgi:uncharacterized protein YbjT (DUF2867 family)